MMAKGSNLTKDPPPVTVQTPDNSVQSKPRRGLKKLLLVLLVLLLMAAAFAGGWFYQEKKIDKLEEEKKAAEEKVEKKLEVVRVQVARPADRRFSVEIPLDWFSRTCGEHLLFVANTEPRLGKCNTEYFGMISLSSSDGDTREPTTTYTGSADYADVSVESVTINGVPGNKISYRFVGESIVGYPATGSSFITYQLFNGTHTFSATYDRNEGETDYRSQFEDIVESLDTTP